MPDLARGGALTDAIATFARGYSGAEGKAVASLWSAYLFAGLIAPGLAAGARLGLALPVAGVRLAPETGLPATIHLAEALALPASVSAQVERLLADCVAPTIRLLRTETGLSARLLWENAGGYLFWTLGEIAQDDPARAADVTQALRALRWPREACSALTLMRADALAGPAAPRRRVCCLRYTLPGFSTCEGVCPLLRRGTESRDGSAA